MILVLNTGSSSVKWAVIGPDGQESISGSITGIGGDGVDRCGDTRASVQVTTHAEAVARVLARLVQRGINLSALSGVAHRIVHGGTQFVGPALLDAGARDELERLKSLAPLHLPPALAAIDAIRNLSPDLRQAASFDTAFHACQSEVATTYALPRDLRAEGLRQFGFHGLSYAGLCDRLGADLPRRLIAFHIGAGVSICAILDGKSVATTMGYSPLSGPPMATRSGDLDPLAVLDIARRHGIDGASRLLSQQSGLLGLSGISGDWLRLRASDDPAARFAIDVLTDRLARAAASLIPTLGGVDAVAFTGGIGQNDAALRDAVMARLAWVGALPVHVVPAEEERRIALECLPLLERA